ncbi:MAG: hypothetical protein ABSB49_09770 [Polyangia bacterium]|jgi:hypothetical protein
MKQTAPTPTPDPAEQALARARAVIATIPKDKLVLLRIMCGPDDLAIAERWQALTAPSTRAHKPTERKDPQ